MSDKSAPPNAMQNPSNLSIQPPPPASHTSPQQPNAPFTPRSQSFPDGLESDDGFDVFDPTPVHSPHGPHYDDLPPTYDQAQQEALEQARAGITPPTIEELEIRRLVLSDSAHPSQPPPPHELDSSRPSIASSTRTTITERSSLIDDPNAYEFQPENRRLGSGLGYHVPVTGGGGSETIPVSQTGSREAVEESALLKRALEFTKLEPEADVGNAPKLSRPVAIPQHGLPGAAQNENHSGHAQAHRRGERRGRGHGHGPRGHSHDSPRGRHGRRGGRHSSEDAGPGVHHHSGTTQFLRAYAKVLYAHSIRPAEFAEFLDGLNSLCIATGTTPHDLIYTGDYEESPAELVYNYINSANEAYFGPRGLKISLQSLPELLDAISIPEERNQKATAVDNVLDRNASAGIRALALYPWIEKLETDIPAASTGTQVLREMSVKFRHEAVTSGTARSFTSLDLPRTNSEASGSGSGRGGFGYGGRGRGGFGGRGGFVRGPSNHFEAFGKSIGKWGERFGKDMGQWGEKVGKDVGKWGEDVGKRTEAWGTDVGRRAETWGNDVGRRVSRQAEEMGQGVERGIGRSRESFNRSISGISGKSGQSGEPAGSTCVDAQAGAVEEGINNEIGVVREPTTESFELEGKDKGKGKEKSKKDKEGKKKDKKKHKEDVEKEDDLDYDSSSSSSDSSSSDSDSEDEDDFPDTHQLYEKRIGEINAAAEAAHAKGKKPAEQISRERDQAIKKANIQKSAWELKIEAKRERRAWKREMRTRKRELRREFRAARREMRGMKRGGPEWKEKKKEVKGRWREEKAKYREEKRVRRENWKERRQQTLRGSRGLGIGGEGEGDGGEGEDMVWVVVENLG